MSDIGPQDEWQQWLSPNWFSGCLVQGSPVASDATGLEQSVMQGGHADHAICESNAGNERMPLMANEGRATNNARCAPRCRAGSHVQPRQFDTQPIIAAAVSCRS